VKPRALVPLLCVLACAIGDEESQLSVGSATVPTMPTVPTSLDPADSGEPATDPTDDSSDPATTNNPSIPDPSTTTFPTTTDPAASSSTAPPDTGDDTTTDAASTTVPVDTGDDCGPCDSPPGQCYANPGSCINGACDYAPTPDGSDCDDGDECTGNDVCNGAGSCVPGPAAACSAPHTTGGTCQNGSCVGFQCVAPYENCDGDWENGCEVPVGVANQCDAGGLTPDGGCWTAYCGASNDADATNFGTYHCIDCATCHEPSQGQWQWCNHTSGNWYPPEAGGPCGVNNKDLVCKPG
jgi:hypothetical protein